MTVFYMVLGGVVVFISLCGILVAISRKEGSASTRADSLDEGHRRRVLFDNETSRAVALGKDLVDRFRRMGK